MKLTIRPNGQGNPMSANGITVLLDGVDVGRYLKKLSLSIEVGKLNVGEFTLIPREIEVDAEVLPILQKMKSSKADGDLKRIIDQLKACGYQCEAGPLELNTAFIELERRANEEDDEGDYDGTLL